MSSSKRRGDNRGGETGGQRELPPLAGALGNKKSKRRRRKRRNSDGTADTGSDKTAQIAEEPVQNPPSARNVLPTFLDSPKVPGDNLAGVPYSEIVSELGVKEHTVKYVGPWIQSNLNNESFIHFVVHSRTDEWIHFDKDAVSIVIFTETTNAAYNAAAAPGSPEAAQWHATVAKRNQPGMMLDPDIGGTGFFQRAEVIINNNAVPTSHTIGPLFVHYPRQMKIHAQEDYDKKEPHFTNSDQIGSTDALRATPIMQKALEPFDHGHWSSRHGRRISVHLDAIFPFAVKSPLHEALENCKADRLCFPPDTRLELKLYFQRSRMECIWMLTEIGDNYWNLAQPVNAHGQQLRTTIQEATLEYNSVVLHPMRHAALMQRFRSGREIAYYDYDINRGQNLALTPNVSYTETNIQIWPYCRTLIIGFAPDHAVFPHPHLNRPMSGFSTFPKGLTRMQVEFANTVYLISANYENFGIAGEQNQISKKQTYEYLKSKRLVNYTFAELWPEQGRGQSLVQELVVDTRHLLSDKVQTLKITMQFGGEAVSPTNTQIIVTSIHPNGRATCKNLSSDRCNWEWTFHQLD